MNPFKVTLFGIIAIFGCILLYFATPNWEDTYRYDHIFQWMIDGWNYKQWLSFIIIDLGILGTIYHTFKRK